MTSSAHGSAIHTTVDHVALLVEDLERAVAVLVETFGWTEITSLRNQSTSPTTYNVAYLERDGVRIELIEAPAGALFPHLALRVNDLDDAIGRLHAAGIATSPQIPVIANNRASVWTNPDGAGGLQLQLVQQLESLTT